MKDIDEYKWKHYDLSWCELCDAARIICPTCRIGSCTGGGCDVCLPDQREFDKSKLRVQDYLTPPQAEIYEKCLRLKRWILKSLSNNEERINFTKLKQEGKLSQHEENMFAAEIAAGL